MRLKKKKEEALLEEGPSWGNCCSDGERATLSLSKLTDSWWPPVLII
jgi:hypothetical protein